jgi:ubiquinone/menaquinone biosynthesis C-methylase UbiE
VLAPGFPIAEWAAVSSENRKHPLGPSDAIYEPGFVTSLFDEMSASYGITNYVSSFGFCERWRRQAIEGAKLRPGMLVVDLMTGMGECWHFIRRRLAGVGRIIAIDWSTEMIRRANGNRSRFGDFSIEVRQADALDSGLDGAQADCVVACFGLKTLSPAQLDRLSAEVWRILKPGGGYSFVEIAVPTGWLLRVPYLSYLRYAIPLLGRVFLGNPDNYRMLNRYAERFAAGDAAIRCFAEQGFSVRVEDLFFGCARWISGEKPRDAA